MFSKKIRLIKYILILRFCYFLKLQFESAKELRLEVMQYNNATR